MINLEDAVSAGDRLYATHAGLRGVTFVVINVERDEDGGYTDFECVDQQRRPWTIRHGDFDDYALVIDDEGKLSVEVRLDDIYEDEHDE